MIILLDTSTAVCKLTFVDNKNSYEYRWQADRNLANGLLRFILEKLNDNDINWSDISAIGVFRGPGSFTGLRIGITVMNTIANSENIQIIGGIGDDWKNEVLKKIELGINDKIVLPFYDSEARITAPRK